jgi:hypothetical protein
MQRAMPEIDFDSSIPSMIKREEYELLYLLARDHFRGEGNIIDAGVFVGSSTLAFGRGLLASGKQFSAPPIHTYELGVADDYMANWLNGAYGSNLKFGDSFLPYLRENIEPVRQLVCLYEGDVRMAAAPEGYNEIVFLDVCKSPEINAAAISKFFGTLVPGHSIVIQQDYIHEWLPWIHVSLECLHDYFRLEQVVQCSAVFGCLKPIPKEALAYDPWRLSGEECLRLFDLALERWRWSPAQWYVLALARTRLLADRISKQAAIEYLNSLVVPAQDGSLPYLPAKDLLRNYCDEHGV